MPVAGAGRLSLTDCQTAALTLARYISLDFRDWVTTESRVHDLVAQAPFSGLWS